MRESPRYSLVRYGVGWWRSYGDYCHGGYYALAAILHANAHGRGPGFGPRK